MEKKAQTATADANAGNTPDDAGSQKLKEMFNISLMLDTYDDIFSDFDPRHYSQRALSDDFLLEAKKASRDKVSGKIELNFIIPTAARDIKQEAIIKKRLREHFRKHYGTIHDEYVGVIRQGIYFILSGILIMLATSFILFNHQDKNIFFSFLIILLEPGGWFLFWTGLDILLFRAKLKKPDMDFYEKMSKCEISFMVY